MKQPFPLPLSSSSLPLTSLSLHSLRLSPLPFVFILPSLASRTLKSSYASWERCKSPNKVSLTSFPLRSLPPLTLSPPFHRSVHLPFLPYPFRSFPSLPFLPSLLLPTFSVPYPPSSPLITARGSRSRRPNAFLCNSQPKIRNL